MFSLTLSCILICGFAALVGGFMDAVSGGGGLMTIPALLLTGVPPHYALGTNKLSAFLGTSVALANYGKHGLVSWRLAAWGVPFSILGSWFGSLLALYLDATILGKILVILLPLAMVITLLPSKKRVSTHVHPQGLTFWLLVPCVCLAIGCYDGFFGPATGTLLILLLHWALRMDLIGASATAKAFNLASNISAAISFVWHGTVFWILGLIMGACFTVGNWAGSAFAIRFGSQSVRKFLVFSLFLLMATLLWQYFLAPLFLPGN